MNTRCGCWLSALKQGSATGISRRTGDRTGVNLHPALLDMATVWDLIELGGADVPGMIACRRRESSGKWIDVTWDELHHRATSWAQRLAWLGLRRGDRLAIRARTCLNWLVAELAAARLGAVVVGLDAHASKDGAALALKKSRAQGLLFDEGGRPASAAQNLRFALSFEELQKIEPAAELPPPPDFADPATLIFTSGTTGEPKGILYTHAQILTAVNAILTAYPSLGPRDVAAAWLPMNHLFQRVMNLVALSTGAPISFVEDPREIAERLPEVRPTVFVGVPRFYEKLQEGITAKIASAPPLAAGLARAALEFSGHRLAAERSGERLSLACRLRGLVLDRLALRRMRAAMGGRIRFMITGSAPASREMLDFFHGIGLPLMEAYGLSENVVPMAVNRPGDCRPGSVGKPLPENEIRFASGGEILVRGPGVFRGYCDEDEQETAGRFTPDGFYRTGDIGYMDEDGYLYLRGRESDLIKTSTGRRISPAKIEAIYAAAPEIEHFVVVGHGRKHLAALVTLRPGAAADIGPAAMKAKIAAQMRKLELPLAAHERIREFEILPGHFSISGGELTGKLSLRRAHVLEKHAGVIENIYAAARPIARDSRITVSA